MSADGMNGKQIAEIIREEARAVRGYPDYRDHVPLVDNVKEQVGLAFERLADRFDDAYERSSE